MKKRILIIMGISIFLLLLTGSVIILLKDKGYDDSYSLVPYAVLPNDPRPIPDDFEENQKTSMEMYNRFLNKLPYSGKYSVDSSIGDYKADGIPANGYPAYYGGKYINFDGKLIVNIKEDYYEEDYRHTKWYKEMAKMFGSQDFACRSVKYSFSELLDAYSELAEGSLGKEIVESAEGEVVFRIDEYNSRCRICVKSRSDQDKIRELVSGDIYVVQVVAEGNYDFVLTY